MLVAELVIYSSPKLLINPRLTYLTNLANIILVANYAAPPCGNHDPATNHHKKNAPLFYIRTLKIPVQHSKRKKRQSCCLASQHLFPFPPCFLKGMGQYTSILFGKAHGFNSQGSLGFATKFVHFNCTRLKKNNSSSSTKNLNICFTMGFSTSLPPIPLTLW